MSHGRLDTDFRQARAFWRKSLCLRCLRLAMALLGSAWLWSDWKYPNLFALDIFLHEV